MSIKSSQEPWDDAGLILRKGLEDGFHRTEAPVQQRAAAVHYTEAATAQGIWANQFVAWEGLGTLVGG